MIKATCDRCGKPAPFSMTGKYRLTCLRPEKTLRVYDLCADCLNDHEQFLDQIEDAKYNWVEQGHA